MGRRRFEIRAFCQLRRWNQTCECLLLRKLIWSVYGWPAWTDLSYGGTMSVQYPGRVFQISSDGVDRMEAKIKTQKNTETKNYPPPPPPTKKENPMPNFRSLKVYRKQNKFDCTLFAELRDRDTRALPRIFRLFWIPKESLLKTSHPKKYLPNFPTQKILRSSPSLEIQSTPLRCSDAVKV